MKTAINLIRCTAKRFYLLFVPSNGGGLLCRCLLAPNLGVLPSISTTVAGMATRVLNIELVLPDLHVSVKTKFSGSQNTVLATEYYICNGKNPLNFRYVGQNISTHEI